MIDTLIGAVMLQQIEGESTKKRLSKKSLTKKHAFFCATFNVKSL